MQDILRSPKKLKRDYYITLGKQSKLEGIAVIYDVQYSMESHRGVLQGQM